ncbi:14657_t:CDS:2, partial [Entrophospora sp. SA101]
KHGAHGIAGLCNLLQASAEKMQNDDKKIIQDYLVNIDAEDDVTIYVGKCIEDIGENQSDADHEDKTEHSGTSCVGKACDFLYLSSSHESGIRENTRPTHKDNHDKSISNFIEIIKIIGMKIRFYLLFQINRDLYGIWDWASDTFPEKDESVRENLLERVGRLTNILTKEAKGFKHKSPEEFP